MAVPAFDVALVLAVDCSSSVDSGDYTLQMQGIANALRQKALPAAIASGKHGQVAIALVQWSTSKRQKLSVPWRLVANARMAETVADEVEAAPRTWLPGGTGLAAAIEFSTAVIQKFPGFAERRVIDISGDGIENDDGDVATARALAMRLGITINGLPVVSGSQLVEPYYRDQVIGGAGSFLVAAQNILAFGDAMERKLLRELQANMV